MDEKQGKINVIYNKGNVCNFPSRNITDFRDISIQVYPFIAPYQVENTSSRPIYRR
jgi:hypothetical protein